MKNLISKNPVQRFQSGKNINFNMSRLIKHADGSYTDKNGNLVTGKDGQLTGEAWKYLSKKYDRKYANRVSWNTRNGNIYQNGKWRANYTKSGMKTVDWNTATNNGKAPKYFTDSKTGKKTYFNESDIPKPVTKPSNKPKVKHKYEGNDLVTSKVRIRNARDHNYLRDAYQRQILPADGIKIEDLPDVLQPQTQFFQVNPLLLFSSFGRTVPSFPSLTQNNKLLGSQKLLGAPNYNGVSVSPRIQTENNWQWADAVPLNRKGGNIQKHQKNRPLFRNVAIQEGWTRNYGNELWNKITDEQKNILKSTGQFTDDSFKDAKSLQIALNNYFGIDKNGSLNPDDNTLSQIAVDNKWGDQSQRAFDEALSSAQYQQYSPSFTVTSNYIPYYPNAQMLVAPKISLSTPTTYNRSGIRNVLREFNLRPYGYSGAQRRALRMMANNTYDDNDKLLVRQMNLPQTLLERLKISLKKGGLIKV